MASKTKLLSATAALALVTGSSAYANDSGENNGFGAEASGFAELAQPVTPPADVDEGDEGDENGARHPCACGARPEKKVDADASEQGTHELHQHAESRVRAEHGHDVVEKRGRER